MTETGAEDDQAPTTFDAFNWHHPWRQFWATLRFEIDEVMHGGELRPAGIFRDLWRGIRRRPSWP